MRADQIRGWVKLATMIASLFLAQGTLPPNAAAAVDVAIVAVAAADRRIGEQLRGEEGKAKVIVVEKEVEK